MNLKKERIETQLGEYIVGVENSLPKEYNKIGDKIDHYKRKIAQRFIFQREEEINDISGNEFIVSIKRDGIFAGLYYNRNEEGKKSFFINSPTRRVYMGLPINKEIEKDLEEKNIEKCLLIGELIATKSGNFEERCRVYTFTKYSRKPESNQQLERIGFKIIDILQLNSEDLRKQPYQKRLNLLKSNFSRTKGRFSRIETKEIKKESLGNYYQNVMKIKDGWQWEGIIARTNEFGYKIKTIKSVDCVIVGYVSGVAGSKITKTQVASVLTALRYKDGSYQILTRVGVGLSEMERKKLYNILKPLSIEKRFEFGYTTRGGRVYKMVKPRVIAEIEYFDLLEENTDGKKILQNILEYNKKSEEWKIINRKPFPKLIFPKFKDKNPIREDKDPDDYRDVRITQITQLVDVITEDKVKTAQLPKSKTEYLLILKKIVVNTMKKDLAVLLKLYWNNGADSKELSRGIQKSRISAKILDQLESSNEIRIDKSVKPYKYLITERGRKRIEKELPKYIINKGKNHLAIEIDYFKDKSLRKIIGIQTNKEQYDYPPFIIYTTDFRREPYWKLNRDMVIAYNKEDMKEVFIKETLKNKTRGFKIYYKEGRIKIPEDKDYRDKIGFTDYLKTQKQGKRKEEGESQEREKEEEKMKELNNIDKVIRFLMDNKEAFEIEGRSELKEEDFLERKETSIVIKVDKIYKQWSNPFILLSLLKERFINIKVEETERNMFRISILVYESLYEKILKCLEKVNKKVIVSEKNETEIGALFNFVNERAIRLEEKKSMFKQFLMFILEKAIGRINN